MPLRERITSGWRRLREQRRRVWSSGRGRAWIEVRRFEEADRRRFAEAVRAHLEAIDGVAWARFNAPLRRVVVSFDANLHRPRELALEIAALEDALGLGRAPFSPDLPDHPGDAEPLVRAGVEVVADLLGFGAGRLLRVAGVEPPRADIDIAALVASLRGIPHVRGPIDDRLGPASADLVLGLADAFVSALVQGTTGPAVDVVHRGLRLWETAERRRVWNRREDALGGRPEAHPEVDGAIRVRREPPKGPIERYSDKAVLASLGGFGVGMAMSSSFEQATASLFGGIPKPARLGRDAFAAWLGRLLAQRDLLVVRPDGLRLLDRMDCVLLDGSLLDDDDDGALGDAIVASARRASVRVVLAGGNGGLDVDEIVDPEDAAGVVERLQADGHGVLLLSGPRLSGASADVVVAAPGDDAPPAWHADVLTNGSVDDVCLVVEALAAARAASEQSVYLSMAEAACALVLSLDGVQERTVRRIMTASNVAALVSIGNAVRLAHGLRRCRPVARRERTPWHAMEVDDVLDRLETTRQGLDGAQAASRRAPVADGDTAARSFARAVIDELANPMAPVLATAAGLSAVMGSAVDAAMVAGVVGLNGAVGGLQRFRTERLLSTLGRRERASVQARRDGALVDVSADALVRGDVIALHAGEVVPADCRIVEACSLEVDESSLTGESVPVCKDAAASRADAVADRSSMLWAGTTIAAGEAVAVVVADPDASIADGWTLEADAPESGVEARLEALTAWTAPIAAVSGVAVLASGLARRREPQEMVGAAVSLAVASVPEGLPLLATLAQLAAARRLSMRGALARNPRAVEALGRVDVLCADKTGTLTEGRIALRGISDGASFAGLDALTPSHRDVLAVALRATPQPNGERALPHPTDRAVVEGAHALGVTDVDAERVDELVFASGRSFHAVVSTDGSGPRLSVKGAPEVVLPRCDRVRRGGRNHRLDQAGREALLDEAMALGRQGLRVLVVAERSLRTAGPLDDDRVRRLVFRGFVALADPVRPSARAAVDALRRAGVAVTMITGDHPSTADAIAVELGILDGGRIVTGADLDALDDDALDAVLPDVTVFARVTPAQKVRIVQGLQRLGRVVAMTGDGTNDAPAIRLADVGIALGEHSTPAAREAADLVVVDERIETLVDAVLEGRGLWASVRDAVAILVGGNLGEIAYTVLGSVADGQSPLNARQLLLVNLLTDALPALSIATRPPVDATPEALLREGPERSLGAALNRALAWRAAVTAGGAAAGWWMGRIGGRERASTVGLLSLVGTQLGQTIAVGGRNRGVLAAGFGSLGALLVVVQVPGVSHFFGCRPLGPIGLAQAALASTAATGVAVVGPPVGRRLRPWVRDLVERDVEPTEWFRVVSESRVLSRLRGVS